jgi:hypothetical protein
LGEHVLVRSFQPCLESTSRRRGASLPSRRRSWWRFSIQQPQCERSA